MAREFILFVHICHWIGGRTAVPFKTSPGLLTACHRGEMKTSRDGGGRRPPGGRTHLTVDWDFYFLPRTQTFFLSSLESTFQEEPPQYGRKDCESVAPHRPHQRLAEQVSEVSRGENTGRRGRGPDSSVTSFTPCVTSGKTTNDSGPHFLHL